MCSQIDDNRWGCRDMMWTGHVRGTRSYTQPHMNPLTTLLSNPCFVLWLDNNHLWYNYDFVLFNVFWDIYNYVFHILLSATIPVRRDNVSHLLFRVFWDIFLYNKLGAKGSDHFCKPSIVSDGWSSAAWR